MRMLSVFWICCCSWITASAALAGQCMHGGPPRYVIEDGAISYDFFASRTVLVHPDLATFNEIPLPPHVAGACETASDAFYAKDKSQVYYKGKVIDGADPASLQPFAEFEYARDATRVFYQGRLLKNADPDTFAVLRWPVEAAESGTRFWPPRGEDWSVYAVDGHHVWDQGRLMPMLDAPSFAVLPMKLTKDKNGVYKDGKLIPGLDPATVRP
jgi:hypothetical protein